MRLRAAFTLIELLIVLSLLVILAGFAYPAMRRTYETSVIEGFGRRLVGLFGYLRQRSFTEDEVFVLHLDEDRRTLWFQKKDGSREGRALKVPGGVSLRAAEPEIYFYPDGVIDGAVGIEGFGREANISTQGVWAGVAYSQAS